MGINQIAARLRLSGAFVANEVNELASDGRLEKSARPGDGPRVQLVAIEKDFELLTQRAPVQRPVYDALFGAPARDAFKHLLQLLTRLVAGGGHAGAFVEYFEASMAQGNLRSASASKPQRRQTQAGHGK